MRRAAITAFLLAVVFSMLLLLPAVAEETARGYVKGQGYQYYQFGSYPQGKKGETAPLLWRALQVEDQKILLMTEYVIDEQQVIFETDQTIIQQHAYRRISNFAQSDLCGWMNTTMLSAVVGESGLDQALISGEYGKLILLSDDQMLRADYGFSAARYGVNPTRQAEATAYAVSRGVYRDVSGFSPYWVANVKAAEGYKLQIVGYNGHLSYGAYTRTDIGIRPAVQLDLSRVNIIAGDGSRKAPFQISYAGGTKEETNGATSNQETVATLEPRETGAGSDPINKLTKEKTDQNAIQASAEPTEEASVSETPAPESKEDEDFRADPSGDTTATLSLLGDCSIGDAYRVRKKASSLTSVITEKGKAWPFAQVSEILKTDDLTAANLEVCLTESTKPIDILYPMIAPPENAEVLAQGGVEIVNTVNNHSFDFGTQGYDDTLTSLDSANILHFGTAIRGGKAYSDLTSIVDAKGIRFGFIGFSYPQLKTLEAIGERIKALRAEGCDVVVVSLHWGRETFVTPSAWQTEYAREVIDLGADVVWGHHPHVLQPIQFYHGKPVLFSTGNFVFATMSNVDPSTGIFQLQYEKTETGAVLRSLTVLPCLTQTSGSYQPYPVTDKDGMQAIWKLLRYTKTYEGYQNLPESFLTTGIVMLQVDGTITEEE